MTDWLSIRSVLYIKQFKRTTLQGLHKLVTYIIFHSVTEDHLLPTVHCDPQQKFVELLF